jgi:RNA polymerase sigma-70 factor (ECF subfamily)
MMNETAISLPGIFNPVPTPTLQRRAAAKRADARLTNDELAFLVQAVGTRRDRAAFAELYRHFAPRLKGFGLRRGVDNAAAEELAQETMLTVWRKADTFDPAKATVSTWIFTIVRNKRIDLFRREGYPEIELDEVEETSAKGDSPEQAMSSAQSQEAVRSAIKKLPAEQLKIIQMAFFEDKSHSVIANELKLPLGTVKSRIRLALSRLRIAMPQDLKP